MSPALAYETVFGSPLKEGHEGGRKALGQVGSIEARFGQWRERLESWCRRWAAKDTVLGGWFSVFSTSKNSTMNLQAPTFKHR
jgi:hypothetical protein